MHEPLAMLLMQVALILGLSRIMGWLFRWFRQPQVMGEMVAGMREEVRALERQVEHLKDRTTS